MLKNSYSSVAAVPYLKTVRCWLLTMEAKVWSQSSPCGICSRQSGTVTGFSQSSSLISRQYHSTNALNIYFVYHICYIIFITDQLHGAEPLRS
jgi:hypothetical protein